MAPGRFDPRLRIAADLYNWSLAAAFASTDGWRSSRGAAPMTLPFGQIEVAFDPAALRAGRPRAVQVHPDRRAGGLRPGDALSLAGHRRAARGLHPAHRRLETRPGPGGAADAGAADGPPPDPSGPARPRRRAEPLAGQLELHLAWDGESVTIAGETGAARERALGRAGAHVHRRAGHGARARSDSWAGSPASRRSARRSSPPRRTAPGSSPSSSCTARRRAWSAGRRCTTACRPIPRSAAAIQFWFFQYDSGNPIALSALRLRDALTAAVAQLDPEGKDPALRRMVLIGHSQGGLLVKMQAISTRRSALERGQPQAARGAGAVRRDPRPDPTRGLFVEPLPGGRRASCSSARRIAGSYVAAAASSPTLVRRLVTLPFALTGVARGVSPGIRRSPEAG